MTSPETVLNGNSVKTKLYNTLPPYLIVLANSVTTLKVKAVVFHIIHVCMAWPNKSNSAVCLISRVAILNPLF